MLMCTTAIADVGRARHTLAYGVIEDQYAVGAGRGLDQPFRLRIVDALDLVFIVKIPYRTFLANQGKPLAVERNRLADRPDVMNGQAVRLRHDIRPGLAGRRLKGIGTRLVQRRHQIVEVGLHE